MEEKTKEEMIKDLIEENKELKTKLVDSDRRIFELECANELLKRSTTSLVDAITGYFE